MGDETTSTSISGEQDPVYTESLTKTLGRPPRKLYFFLQFFALVLTIGICFVSQKYKDHFATMEVRHLSQFTSMAMAVRQLRITPVRVACAGRVGPRPGLLAIRGGRLC